MDYHEAANVLFGLRRFAPRAGTDATRALLDHLGDPHADVTYVQVAGSNGKGSTARMTAAILREAGLDVGLYTSPHLDDVRERVRVNGRPMSASAVRTFVTETQDYLTDRAAAGEAPTFFEAITAMALWQFCRQEVDVAVLEVGIGGRFDATSVIAPAASAVTSVTLEHTEVLGETVEEIARDKAHVVPADRPLVTAATGSALGAIREVAGEVVTVGGPDATVTVEYAGRDGLEGVATISTPEWSEECRLALLGAHQATNAGVAATLARQVADVASAAVVAGLRRAHWPGRFEVLSRSPLVVLDGAHNPGGIAAVGETLATFDYDDLHLVVGALCEKDHEGMAAAVPPARTVRASRPDHHRAEEEAVVARACADVGETVTTRHAVADALDDALADADDGDCVLVTGSLYVVAEARRRWSGVQVPIDVPDVPTARTVLERANVTSAGVWRMRGKGVHRVVHARVQPRQAGYLKEELLSRGGECAVSGVRDDEELIDVVMMGTLSQFRRLIDALEAQTYGLGPLGDRLRTVLGIGVERPSHGYPWEERTAVMGILNVTPDSFHDGGRYDTREAAIDRAGAMVAAGADIVDVGGESTRPGAAPVDPETEIDRVVPVIEGIADADALVSIDTRKPAVARAALEAGADIVNDVSGLGHPAMPGVVADHDVPVVVMHSIETPVDPETAVTYDDVVGDVIADLAERIIRAERAGVARSKIVVDPGLGFGKTATENFELLGRLDEFHALGCPVLVGHSHKSMFELVDRDSGERRAATIAGTALAAARGADIVRVHDVAANVAAVRTARAAVHPDEV